MEKSRLERDIATLRKRNADLNLLRTHFSTQESRSYMVKSIDEDAQRKIKRLATIRLAANLLHDTLKAAWSCSDSTHVQHWAKLCVDTETRSKSDSVTLDMAVSSETAGSPRYAQITSTFNSPPHDSHIIARTKLQLYGFMSGQKAYQCRMQEVRPPNKRCRMRWCKLSSNIRADDHLSQTSCLPILFVWRHLMIYPGPSIFAKCIAYAPTSNRRRVLELRTNQSNVSGISNRPTTLVICSSGHPLREMLTRRLLPRMVLQATSQL